MAIDRADDFDVPSDEGGADRGNDGEGGRVQVEVRDRFEYYESLRAADDSPVDVPDAIAPDVSAETSPERQESRDVAESWQEAAERFRTGWAEHRERWPPEGREPVDRSGDPEGSWRGDSGRYLDSAANAEVEERFEWIAEAERNVVSPAMREIEACDPDRRLVGFEHRLKGLDRIKDKVAADVEEKGRTTVEALPMVKDIIRYTFVYSDEHYARGVCADMDRIESRGFSQVERRNTWGEDHYKGINSRWREPETGQLFEVQFHTQTSYEAKQLTHCAYEQIRNPNSDRAVVGELRRLQGDTCRHIPIPFGVMDISDYPREGK